jgi:excisionase family DNA binding protein
MDPKRLYTLTEITEALALRGSLQDQIDELKRQFASLSAQIGELKTQREYSVTPAPKVVLSRKEAATALAVSVSTVDMLIGRGMLRVRRQGRRVLVPAVEIGKFSKREITHLWPAKVDGKTVNRMARNRTKED